jgi:peroxiredoxin
MSFAMPPLARPWPLLLTVLSLGCGAAMPPSAASPLLEQPLPTFARQAIGGEPVSTAAPLGRVVVVKFFAKYCPPCRKTLPAAEQLHERRADVAFIGIAEDPQRGDVDELVATYRLSFPVIHDRDNALADQFGVSVLPATFVADAHGRIRWVGGERQSESDLAAAIESLSHAR